MKILDVKELAFPEVKVITYARFGDERGYFTETFNRTAFNTHPQLSFFKDLEFRQCNEAHSSRGVVRGLHFQWNPYMGKLVRTVHGHMVDLVMDIRKESPTFGKLIAYDMPAKPDMEFSEWIWVPVGFAHGNFYLEDTTIEYFCTAEWSQGCEGSIKPLSTDIDWSLCDPAIKGMFEKLKDEGIMLSEKDQQGNSLAEWQAGENSDQFIFGKV